MVELDRLVRYCDDLLDAPSFSDYAPNGLQIEGRGRIGRIVTGVTACQALIDAAIEARADLLLVHHGFFWKSETLQITGIKHRRIAALIRADIGLLAYHLPLDAHPELGNNARLAHEMGWSIEGRFGRDELGFFGSLPRPVSAAELKNQITATLGREPLHLPGGRERIERIAWCSGAAQGFIEEASALGVDAFVSGEVSESTTHFAREAGIHYFACGHHATERYGVQALGDHLSEKFDVECNFIEIDNPV